MAKQTRFAAAKPGRVPGCNAVTTTKTGGRNVSRPAVRFENVAENLRPLPFREQERLVVAWKSDETTKHPFVEISIPEFNDWRNRNQAFEHLAAMTTSIYGFNYMLTGRGEPEQIHSARVSSDFFPALGVKPSIGRAFTADEDRPGAAGVAVISHGLWQKSFNADPKLIGQMITFNDGGNQSALEAAVKPGQTIKLNDTGFTIIGVMPPDFEFLKGIDMWVPLSATSGKDVVESRIGFLQAVGRLKPSVTLEQATAELDTIIGRIAAQHPEMRASGERAVVKPLATYIFGDARPALYLLLAATALLLEPFIEGEQGFELPISDIGAPRFYWVFSTTTFCGLPRQFPKSRPS